MQHFQAERRLAAILAIDVVGYSGRAEADEAGAVRIVADLARLASAAAEVEGGRVFNTAGDGFMLEFPTASGALAAAEAIVASAPAPVRVGAHLGEVNATAGGDLLGHGVNVAARLQSIAAPGEIVASDDVRRAVRGPLAERLAPVGRVRLAKMKEVGAVFSLTADGSAGRRRRLVRLGRLAAVLVGVALLAVAGFAIWRSAAPEVDPLTVAVRDFESGPAGPGAAYGQDAADRMSSALAERETPTVSRDRVRRGDLGGARLLLGGRIERDGDLYRIRVRIDDAKVGLFLWSADYERPASEATALQEQAAVAVADIVGAVREDLGPEARTVRADVLAAYLKAVEAQGRNRGNFDATREAYRRLLELAPDSARVHASFAYATRAAIRRAKAFPEVAAELRRQAEAEARKALELAPKDPVGYIALYSLRQERDYVGAGEMLEKALALEPNWPILTSIRSDFLRSVGRPNEALPYSQATQAAGILPPGPTAGLIFSLSGVGRYSEAKALGRQAARLMPDHNSIRRANLFTALLYGTPDEASAALDAFQQGRTVLDPESERAWRAYVEARRGKLPAAVAAKALSAAPRGETSIDPTTVMTAFVVLGRLDEAFAELERARAQDLEMHTSNLFEQAARPILKDPRFMPTALRLGLVDYWMKSGRWPEFCQAPDRPYDCREKAAAAIRVEGTEPS